MPQPPSRRQAEEAPQEPVRTETRDIFEIFLDSVCLDDALLTYLIDILKRRSKPEFAKLSHAAARTELKLDDFLAWLGNMELLAGEDEQACAAIMDKCLYRLEQEGEMELIAALLSGDETTFKLFRTQAPELVHLPDATSRTGIAGTIPGPLLSRPLHSASSGDRVSPRIRRLLMEPIYVTGHRNPDTDSIVSAMAYAALRNALGDREFVPCASGAYLR